MTTLSKSKLVNVGSGNLIQCQVVEVYTDYGILFTGLNSRSSIQPWAYYFGHWVNGLESLKDCKENDVFGLRGSLKPNGDPCPSFKFPGREYAISLSIVKCTKIQKIVSHKYPPHKYNVSLHTPLISLPQPLTTHKENGKGWLIKEDAIGKLVALELDSIIVDIKRISTTKVDSKFFIPERNSSSMMRLIMEVTKSFPQFTSDCLIDYEFS